MSVDASTHKLLLHSIISIGDGVQNGVARRYGISMDYVM